MSFFKDKGVYVIAEAGVNHNRDVDLAFKLIDIAKEAGADAVKFQTFISELEIDDSANKAQYQVENMGTHESQLEMAKQLEFPQEVFADLKAYANKIGITFLSTPFDPVSVDTLAKLNVDAYKASSCCLTNYPLLVKIARQGKPVIISSGMSDMSEVDFGVQTLKKAGVKEIGLLHCVSNYPARLEDCNMLAIKTLADKYPGIVIGWSDHSLGNSTAIMAVTLGARIIEKHYTISKDLPGPDHKASASPEELKEYVRLMRLAATNAAEALKYVPDADYKKAIGDGNKRPMPSELPTAAVAKRSLYSYKPIVKGQRIEVNDLLSKRPPGGISPMETEMVIGSVATENIAPGTKLNWDILEKALLNARKA